jgi:hypothetical protein
VKGFAIAALLATVAAACKPAREPAFVSMRLVGGPAAASVTIDDIFVGTFDVVSARGVALPVGAHRVSVEAPGYFPWDQMVEAAEGRVPVRLEVRLVPTPD